MKLEVLIPVKKRVTLSQTLLSLLGIQLVDLITIVTPENDLQLNEKITTESRIRVIKIDMPQFNKSSYLNECIRHSRGEVILISDADILWNYQTVQQLYETVTGNKNSVAHIAQVQESEGQSHTLKRTRLKPYLTKITDNEFHLKLIAEPSSLTRPGCGLICSPRNTLINLGGYNEQLQQWGWEDQDLLIRSQIFGYSIISLGQVIHLSHGDSLRNLSGEKPLDTRNQNILTSCQMLTQGQIKGSLAPNRFTPHLTIKIELPTWLVHQNEKTS